MSALTDLFTLMADRIRRYLGTTTTKYKPSEFPDAIDRVYTSGVASAKIGNASEADVRFGKTFTNSVTVSARGSMPDYSNTRMVATTVSSATDMPRMRLSNGYYEVTMPTGYWYSDWASSAALIPAEEKSHTPSSSSTVITPSSGKVLSKVTVSAVPTEEKSQTPGTSAINVTPSSGKFLSKVTVSAIPNQHSYGDWASDVEWKSGAGYVTFEYGWWPQVSGGVSYIRLNTTQTEALHSHSLTYKPTARKSNNDMGEFHSRRYVDTTSVPNSNSGTYTLSYGENIGMVSSNAEEYVVDLGATNSYQKVNYKKIYYTGYEDGARNMINKGSEYYSNTTDPLATAKYVYTCGNHYATIILIYITGSENLGDNYDPGGSKIVISSSGYAADHAITYTADSGKVKLAIIKWVGYGTKITINADSKRVNYRIIFLGKEDNTYYDGMS